MADNRIAKYILDEYYTPWKINRQPLESIWSMCYDAFRGDYSSENLRRWKSMEGMEWRSQVFVRLTKIKIISALAQIQDLITDEMPYTIEPTPISKSMHGEIIPPEIADQKALMMKKCMDDILVESDYVSLIKSAFLEAAIYGMSWHKAPVIRTYKTTGYKPVPPVTDYKLNPAEQQKYTRYEAEDRYHSYPVVEQPNLWDIFYDMDADDPQDGFGIIHRVKMSPGQLAAMRKYDGYNKQAISAVLGKNTNTYPGNAGADESPSRRNLSNLKKTIEVLEFWGKIPKKELGKQGYTIKTQDKISDLDEVEVFCTIADGQVIRDPQINPLRMRPFHCFKWESLPHSPAGCGIAENLQDSQMMINSAVRCFIDNKALSGNILMFGSSKSLAPGQNKTIYPGKWFEAADHITDVKQALQFMTVPDIGAGMIDMINLFERFADEESNIPKLFQGESAKHEPSTAFVFNKLLLNATKTIGNIIDNADRGLIAPAIKSIYYWLMDSTLIDEEIKGDFNVIATGFSSFKEKAVRGQNLQDFFTLMMSNPMLSELIKIREFVSEIAKTRNIDPDKFLYSEQEIQQKMLQHQQMMQQEVAAQQGMQQGTPPGGGV